jgi:transposase
VSPNQLCVLKGVLLRAGDPNGDVATVWEAKEAFRELYAHVDPELALEWVTQLGRDHQDYSTEARSLSRSLVRWRRQIAAWHHAHVSNGPTEAANNVIKRVKRVAFGFTSVRNYRIGPLLYGGKPNWDLLATVTPR